MESPRRRTFEVEDGGFIALVIFITLAFAYLLAPYFGAVLWGVVAAIMFQPMTAKLSVRLGGHSNLATSLVLLLLIAVFVVPTILLGINLVNEATALYGKLTSGQIDIGAMLHDLQSALPQSVRRFITQYGLSDLEKLRAEFGSSITTGLQAVAGRLLSVGQGALSFMAGLGVMLYLSFFLLRDGQRYGDLVRESLPLNRDTRDSLIDHFLLVVRATMRGTVVVAVVQGAVGGILFSLLGIEGALIWGVLMGFLSLLPAVGTGFVWVPVAVYLFATGEMGKAAILVFCGVFIIGMVDNVLRPILVGRDTRMPDFVVLISTLSGLELFGLNGFIIGPVIAALFMAVWNQQRERKLAMAAEMAAADSSTEATEETAAHPS
ncbi:AI-2E family transporter [Novosphingobium mangrovi (ex Huang et al. 2023)]|uniref:AI-2E family transporter n=1 Tax=Novosphingobium mangrovi (ex Huang et al. 2023) TaxID=2976432 RepID=A0ABT2I5C3_9SPHN|nr:AI-2E family transporter [Novosphingobium mangrovi (ex Huang et al. 2023)]MCT2399747.1 AI-2E family transporter [Novosphingobium mangrovi (ex Huang et al. 2023)]